LIARYLEITPELLVKNSHPLPSVVVVSVATGCTMARVSADATFKNTARVSPLAFPSSREQPARATVNDNATALATCRKFFLITSLFW
jgi:hypothetical protein